MKTTHLMWMPCFMAFSIIFFPTPQPSAPTGPSGSFKSTVTSVTNAVWDVAGVITNDAVDVTTRGGTRISFSFPVSITQKGTGQLKASGKVNVVGSYDGSAVDFLGSYNVSGSISSAHKAAHIRVNGAASGAAYLFGAMRRVTATDTYTAVLDPVTMMVSGTHHVILTASGIAKTATQSFGPEVISAFGNFGDGSWMLTFTVSTTSSNKVKGSGAVALNSGQVFNYTINGTFHPSKNTSTLTLTGADSATRGSTLVVTMSGNTVVRIKGSISGQLVNATF